MTDTTVADTATQAVMLEIPVVKAKGSVQINLRELPDDVYQEALLQGLKVIVNRGTSKITKTTYPNEDELKAAALKKAEEQVTLCLTSKIKFTGKKAKKVSGAVNTEAMKIARQMVKDAIKSGQLGESKRVSHYAASEITKAAKALIEVDPSIIQLAEEEIARREEKGKTATGMLDIGKLISVDPKLVAAASAKKAKGKDKPLSAKQAGMTAKRSKGAPAQANA